MRYGGGSYFQIFEDSGQWRSGGEGQGPCPIYNFVSFCLNINLQLSGGTGQRISKSGVSTPNKTLATPVAVACSFSFVLNRLDSCPPYCMILPDWPNCNGVLLAFSTKRVNKNTHKRPLTTRLTTWIFIRPTR